MFNLCATEVVVCLRGCRGCVVVEFTNTCAINVYHH